MAEDNLSPKHTTSFMKSFRCVFHLTIDFSPNHRIFICADILSESFINRE